MEPPTGHPGPRSDLDGILMGPRSDLDGILMGPRWDPDKFWSMNEGLLQSNCRTRDAMDTRFKPDGSQSLAAVVVELPSLTGRCAALPSLTGCRH